MPFPTYVQIGRVAYVARGPDSNKLCTIVDVIDQNRVLIDGPCSGVKRQSKNLRHLHLTRFVIRGLQHSARTRTVKAGWIKSEIDKKWKATGWASKLERKQVRANLNDLDRFKLMVVKKARNRVLKMSVGKARIVIKKARKEAPKKKEKKPKAAAKPAGKQPEAAKKGAPAKGAPAAKAEAKKPAPKK